MNDTLTTYGPHNAPNQFYRADGKLNAYGLACGYVEKYKTQQNRFYDMSIVETQLYRDGNCYHVRTSGPPARTSPGPLWDVADTLTEAYKLFAKHKREYHRG